MCTRYFCGYFLIFFYIHIYSKNRTGNKTFRNYTQPYFNFSALLIFNLIFVGRTILIFPGVSEKRFIRNKKEQYSTHLYESLFYVY